MKKESIAGLAVLFLSGLISCGQSAGEQEAILKPIQQMFEGMKKGDSALLHKGFTKQVTMARIGTDKAGKPFIRYESSLDGFLKAVGTPHTETWNEVFWDEKIQIDGNMAQVWMSYAFYLGKKFSHCGVDAFQLVKEADGAWKIFHLADTGQKDGCNVPQRISDQFK